MTFQEHDVVRLRRSLPNSVVQAGSRGAIVFVYEGGQAYEVEFCDEAGITLALVTLTKEDLEVWVPSKEPPAR